MTSANGCAFQHALPLIRPTRTSCGRPALNHSRRSAALVVIPRCSMRPYLERLVKRENLSSAEVRDAITYAVSGDAHEAEIASLLSLLSSKGETSAEVSGVVGALQEHMIPVSPGCDVLDIVGTGGDGADTINISTAASILAAAAGCKVAKHGNRSVSSKSGSADVLEALGVNVTLSPEGVSLCIKEAGIGFMYGPNHHPAMKAISPVRKALKIRTVFNVIGPLLNPCGARYAVIGVYNPALLDIMADVLIKCGVEKAVVVHTAPLDEYSNTGVSEVVEIDRGERRRTTFDAEAELGMPRVHVSALRGGDADENAQVIRNVLSGAREGPITDAIALNAGVGCYVYGLEPSVGDGVKRVKEVLKSGQAIRTLENWAALSQKA